MHELETSAIRIVIPIAPGREHVVIGRGSDNDITLSDRTISRVHAHLRVRAYYLEITDNASRNGTRVNGRPLTPGIPHRLYGGERVRLGDVDLHVVDATSAHDSCIARGEC